VRERINILLQDRSSGFGSIEPFESSNPVGLPDSFRISGDFDRHFDPSQRRVRVGMARFYRASPNFPSTFRDPHEKSRANSRLQHHRHYRTRVDV